MRTRNLVRAALAAALALLVSSAPSGAATSEVSTADVELGPALMIFNDSSDDLLVNGGRSTADPEKDKGKKNGKGHESEGEESGGQESGGGGSGGEQAGDCWTWGRAEIEFFEKLNNARTTRERSQVRLDPQLSWIANRHSYNMKHYQRLYHTPEEKLRERVTRWEILGENVGRGGSVESLHQAFMESQDHRHIVLYREFNYVGVGVAQDGDTMWVTILFEAYDDPGTTMDMPPTC